MELNRREFVAAAAVGLCGCIAGCQSKAGNGVESSDPSGFGHSGTLDSRAAEAAQTGTVDVGTAADYPSDGVYDKFGESGRLLVIRSEGKLSATSAICTHRAQICRAAPGGGSIVCPKHGSRFDLSGNVTKGPSEDPLPHYAIAAGANGRLTVDKGKRVAPGDPAGSVKL